MPDEETVRKTIELALTRSGRPAPYRWDMGIDAMRGGDHSFEISVHSADGYEIGFAVRCDLFASDELADGQVLERS